MTSRTAASLAAVAAALAAAPAVAQDATASPPPTTTAGAVAAPAPPVDEAPPPETTDRADQGGGPEIPGEIVVVATRLPGQVITDKPPIATFDEADIASYGVTNIQDLLTAISPQTGSGRGRGSGMPIVLLNGQRISGFRELRNFPPEAIRKVEVLPEEVALQYGYKPDQRVVNFILKDRFAALTTELRYGAPGRGGYSTGSGEASLMKIQGKSRLNATASLSDQSPLTEAERGIVQPAASVPIVAGDPDPGAFRTLLPDTRSESANVTWARPLGEQTSLSLNAAAQKDNSRSLFGLNGVTLTAPEWTPLARTFLYPDPLTREGSTTTLSAGAALNSRLGDWRLAATADYSHVFTDTRTDRRADASAIQALVSAGLLSPSAALPIASIATFAADRARSRTDTGTSLLTLSGRPFSLPAGDASLTLKAGFDFNGIESSDTRNLGVRADLTRTDVSGGFNLDLPIASRKDGVLAGIGDLSINLNGNVDRLSDFGTLVTYGAGATWKPTDKLGFQASYVARDAAPSLSDLGGPVLVTPNVTVFDFTRGETVLVNVTTGGNPNLVKERQRDLKLGVNWTLPFFDRANLIAEYFHNRSFDTTNPFPLLTPAIEAAFPGRVTRDGGGRLIAIDQRPVTFASETSERIRYGFNIGGAFGKARPQTQQASNPLRQGFAALRGNPSESRAGVGPTGPAPGAPGAPTPGGPGGGGRFDPQVFAPLRAKYCAAGAATGAPASADLAALPERLAARLKRADGSVDPEAWASFRTRLCSGEAGQGRGFDPQAFAKLRQQYCAPGAPTEPPSGEAVAALPERVAARLKRPDGTIDPAQWATFRERLCSANGFGRGQGRAQGDGPGELGQGGDGRRGSYGGAFGGPPPYGGGPGGRGGFGGRGGGPMGGGDGRGRWNLSIYHTVRLEESVRIADGGPTLDLLDGDALSGGGVARHSVELEGGVFYRGFGLRLNGTYTGATHIDGSGLAGSTRLDFHPIATFNLRAFADLGQQPGLVTAAPFFRNSRLALRVDNLFDAQQRVTDATGAVPLRYQPGFLDPSGRLFQVEFRKQF